MKIRIAVGKDHCVYLVPSDVEEILVDVSFLTSESKPMEASAKSEVSGLSPMEPLSDEEWARMQPFLTDFAKRQT